jgi:hypothetical protein
MMMIWKQASRLDGRNRMVEMVDQTGWKLVPHYQTYRIERPFDPTRPRYYMVDTDVLRSTHDFDFVNEDIMWEQRHSVELGDYRVYRGKPSDVKVFAGRDAEGYDCYYTGPSHLPNALPAKPILKVGLRNKPLDVYGSPKDLYVSNRAKQLLEGIDPNAFEFIECDAFTRGKVALEPYWIMNVIGLVQALDEAHSVFREVGGKAGPIPAGRAVGIMNLYEAYMLPEEVKDKHAFYLLKYKSHYIFDEVIVDAWRAAKFTGLRFSPLQPPTKKELKMPYYINSDYFYEDGRKYWEDLI